MVSIQQYQLNLVCKTIPKIEARMFLLFGLERVLALRIEC